MRMTLINNTIIHLLNFEKYQNFQQALKEAAISNQFQVVLLSEEFNPLVIVETRYKTSIDEAIRRCKAANLGMSNSYRLLDIDGVKTYWGTVGIYNERYYLMIVDNEDNYDEEEVTKLAEIIELSMIMWKFTPEHDAKAELVKALIRGNKSLAYQVKEEAEINSNDILSVFYAKNIDNEEANEKIAEFETDGLLKVIKIPEEDATYGLVLRGDSLTEDQEYDEKAIAVKLYDSIKENKAVRIFHATGIDGLEGAADAFRLINETYSFVESVFPFKRVFSKYELVVISNCIAIQVQGGPLRKNYTYLLEPFIKEGDNKTRQLLDTLETFVLDAGMSSGKTADIMHIHTNTVQYRLKKINELLGADITGNRVVPGLTIALALRRLEGANR